MPVPFLNPGVARIFAITEVALIEEEMSISRRASLDDKPSAAVHLTHDYHRVADWFVSGHGLSAAEPCRFGPSLIRL
jgi:hypothetical protein